MSNKFKNLSIKNRAYYLFDDIVNIKNFYENNIKIDEKSYENIHIYYIGYRTIKDSQYIKINSVIPLFLIFSKVNGYFEEIRGNKYLMLVPSNESKKKKKNMKNCGVKSEI